MTAPPTLAHLICANAERWTDRQAIVTPRNCSTYGQVWMRAQQIAFHLTTLGIAAGDRVAILAENCTEWVEIATAVSCAGVPLVALSTWVEEWDLKRLLASSRPTVVFVSARVRAGDVAKQLALALADDPGSIRHVVEIGGKVIAGAIAYDDPRSGFNTQPLGTARDIGLVLYSSGSTSVPKGVALINEDMLVNAAAIGSRIGITENDRLYVPMPFFWAMGGPNGMMTAFTHGAAVVTSDQFSGAVALQLIERERCTALYTLPNMTRLILDHPDFAPGRVASLKRGITVGAPTEIRAAIEDLGVASICNVYGATELYANATVTPHDAALADRLFTQGPPLPGVRVKIVDPETGTEVAPGTQGEIRVSGRVAAGYLQPEGSIASIVDDEGYFSTGDLGFVDDRGWLTYVGRATDMIKTRGINVSPAEVEEFLCSHSDIEAALVFGLDSRSADQLIVAMVVPRGRSTIGEDELRGWCQHRIASYKIPSQFVFVDHLPTTTTGKLSRSIARTQHLRGLCSTRIAAEPEGMSPNHG